MKELKPSRSAQNLELITSGNAPLNIILQRRVQTVCKNSVIPGGPDFPRDHARTYRELTRQHVEPIQATQQKPEPKVQHKNARPNQFPAPHDAENVAEQKEVCRDYGH